jgi:Helix-turn-helix domain
MPWLETVPVEQRERFIDDHRLGLYDMTELCARYAISRKTGYKWLARYDGGGRAALRDRSRAPHTCPHKIAEPVAQLPAYRAAPASGLGAGEAAAVAGPATPGAHVAGDQYGRGSPRPPWLGQETASPPALAAPRCRAGGHQRSQRFVGRGLQRPIPHGRSDLLLPADGHGPTHAILAGLPRLTFHTWRRGAAHLRSAVPPLRPPARDPDRQGRALRVDLVARADPSTSGGCVWASSISGSCPRIRSKTAPTSGCTRRSSVAPVARPGRPSLPSNAPSIAFGRNTTRSVPISFYGAARRAPFIGRRHAPTPGCCRRSSTRAISS